MTSGPAALVRSLPGALGYQPHHELILVGISGQAPTAAVVFAVGLDGTDTEEGAMEVADGLHLMMSGLLHDGATKVAVVVYAPDTTTGSTAARLAATAVVHAETAGLGVLDAIAVSHGRWRSYECTNPSCCPPDGHPITTEPTP